MFDISIIIIIIYLVSFSARSPTASLTRYLLQYLFLRCKHFFLEELSLFLVRTQFLKGADIQWTFVLNSTPYLCFYSNYTCTHCRSTNFQKTV